jgi:anaerobic selenocysteine-containing dehydrogenase
MSEVARRICPVCEAGCSLEVAHEGRSVTGIRGAKSDILSRGFICPKGAALKELDADPDRLRQPLVRRDGVLQPASWDEAFAAIRRGLMPLIEAHGRDSVATYVGNPTAHNYELALGFGVMAKALGSPYVFTAGTVDQVPKQVSSGLMFGSRMAVPVPDIDRSDYLLMLGANPIVSNGSLWMAPDFRGRLREMKARGGKLIIIDPRRSETAEVADRHHFIRPAGDAWFLMALLHVMLREGALLTPALAPHVNGFEDISALAAEVDLARASAACGIGMAEIETIARELVSTPRAAVYGRIGTTAQKYGTLTSWLIDAVNVVAGNLDVPGGAMFADPPAFGDVYGGNGPEGFAIHRYTARVTGHPEVLGEFPLAALAEEIEGNDEGRIRALICMAGNPVLSAPNAARLDKALGTLDFMVAIDIYLSETARHADVVLPGVSPLEKGHYDSFLSFFMTRNVARFSAPVFPLANNALSEWRIMLTLAAIVSGMGADDASVSALEDGVLADIAGPDAGLLHGRGHRGVEAWLDMELRRGPFGSGSDENGHGLTLDKVLAAPDGIDLGALQPRLPGMLRTASGKVELAPQILVDEARRMLAGEAADEDQMSLIGRRQVRSNNSWMHNLPMLAKGPFRCTLMVNPADAARLNITEGGLARVRARTGMIEVQVEITDEIAPGVVSLPHGWGHDMAGAGLSVAAERPGVNSNVLTDDADLDAITGTAVLNGIPVRLEAVG